MAYQYLKKRAEFGQHVELDDAPAQLLESFAGRSALASKVRNVKLLNLIPPKRTTLQPQKRRAWLSYLTAATSTMVTTSSATPW